MKKCSKCQFESENATFCVKCGTPMQEIQKVEILQPSETQNSKKANIEQLNTIWTEWSIVKQIGKGTFGEVYEIMRDDSRGITNYAAVKVISIPQSDEEVSSLRMEGYDATGTHTYFEGIVNDCVSEIQMMVSMKGSSYIVSIEDYKVVAESEKIGWNIFIRMELLLSLNDYISDKKLDELEIVKLGQDICSALEICASKDVIHRDIKPANLFLSSLGNFKLGDFGIARKLEKSGGYFSTKGTYNYMAPEVAKSNHYDSSVDTYSLGIVLYQLLNNNRLPFIDPHAQLIQHIEREQALKQRLDGEELPAPINASTQMAAVILKACAFNPDNRFNSASEMKAALDAVKAGTYVIEPINPNATMPSRNKKANRETPSQEKPQTLNTEHTKPKHKKSRLIALISIIAGIALVGIIALTIFLYSINDPINKLESAIRNGDYDAAAQIYRDELRYGDSDKLSEAERFIVSHAEHITDSYINLEIEYDEALSQLQELERLKIVSESEIAPYIQEINDMRISRVSYDNAVQKMESSDFQSAINDFQKVLQADTNYSDAQIQLVNAIMLYKEQVFEDVSILESDKQYNSAISVIDAALMVIPNDVDLLTKIADIEQLIADEITIIVGEIIQNANNKVTNSVTIQVYCAKMNSGVPKIA